MKAKIFLYPFVLFGLLFILTNNCKKESNSNLVSDIDGNIYDTVAIGTQVWLVENLNVTHYRNGDPIPNVTDSAEWVNLTTGAYCNYDNSSANAEIYGRLYNWFAVNDSRNIAPIGWHVATLDEWIILENYLGGDTVAGGKLKEAGTIHWKSPNYGATNESGFTGLPGGSRSWGGIAVFKFSLMSKYGNWWTATGSDTDQNLAFMKELGYNYILVGGCDCPKLIGYSVRCIKD